jgi:DNA-directed RNA polymerase subunit alpha
MIHKNWQELIKPTQLVVKPGGNDPARKATWSPNRSSAASA